MIFRNAPALPHTGCVTKVACPWISCLLAASSAPTVPLPGRQISAPCLIALARAAFNATVLVRLPLAVTARVASIPALALLKVTAWQDRKHTHLGRDADDLLLYLRGYMDCGNIDRAARDHGDLFMAEDYDHEPTGARLLGRDIALLLDKPALERLLGILIPQTDTQGPLLLAKQSGLDLEKARRLLDAVCDGLTYTL